MDYKIIDFEKKGNVVRFYLGRGNLKTWYGDDWDDAPYEHNAGNVYDEYMAGYTDITFDFDDLVLEPCDGCCNSEYSKDDMVARRVPCIIDVPKELAADTWYTDFQHWAACDGVIKYYFGDRMQMEYAFDNPIKYGEHWERLSHPAEKTAEDTSEQYIIYTDELVQEKV